MHPLEQQIITPEAHQFLAQLHHQFNAKRLELLAKRQERSPESFNFLHDTHPAHNDAGWKVAPPPKDLQKRWVEMTGPTERKMMINALNSGANVFMADFEDALAPTWHNILEGQRNVQEAVAGTLAFTNPEGKEYRLNEKRATLMIRPRGWHLDERHLEIDGAPISASLFDFGLAFFHNAQELVDRGSGPYFYLPKLESHLEARLWNDVFLFAQKWLQLPVGTIRATVLIETIPAAFEMEEILYELRQHITGLNAGRWDYIFSIIKKFQHRMPTPLPDRKQIVMTVPFMHSYASLLVNACHARGAYAIGGMSAFVPSRKDPAINANAFAKVREDKLREVQLGFDGTWVAHPDLVPIAREIFDAALHGKPNQLSYFNTSTASKKELINFLIPEGKITEEGVRQNISVALQYLAAWLNGTGAVAIANLMEDTATAEIARAQLWQWVHHPRTRLDNGHPMTPQLYNQWADDEVSKLQRVQKLDEARRLLDNLVLSKEFIEFLTQAANHVYQK